ncbi:hypothetical protein V6N11_049376 [Hibiscus sabdariffa]|uniref:Uncharacterized protein n=2 Tax=Hibiscus sabdariffa TaxID=183260 RepID=A0ABR1ZWK1_9ROSI
MEGLITRYKAIMPIAESSGIRTMKRGDAPQPYRLHKAGETSRKAEAYHRKLQETKLRQDRGTPSLGKVLGKAAKQRQGEAHAKARTWFCIVCQPDPLAESPTSIAAALGGGHHNR